MDTEYKHAMACYHPLLAFRSEGKIVFNKPFPYAKGFNLPCGQCVGCRLEYSRQWAVRLVHENQMHDKSCFITLTFNEEELKTMGFIETPEVSTVLDTNKAPAEAVEPSTAQTAKQEPTQLPT